MKFKMCKNTHEFQRELGDNVYACWVGEYSYNKIQLLIYDWRYRGWWKLHRGTVIMVYYNSSWKPMAPNGISYFIAGERMSGSIVASFMG